jgi:hypothetical protein
MTDTPAPTGHDDHEHTAACETPDTGQVTLHLPWAIAVRIELDRDGVVEHRVSSLHDDGCVDVHVTGTHAAIAAISAEVVALRNGR